MAHYKVTVEDLEDQTLKPGPHAILLCRNCSATFSANKSDYFHLPAQHVFQHCGFNMRLVNKVMRFVDVLPRRKKKA
jgi:hypothetical protein